ncbi:hypothetical protein FACS1894211_12140 [Clostridia bacterium]|nr:hypothetical protein FACS1894211_12140 [Clostridia bacterium]
MPDGIYNFNFTQNALGRNLAGLLASYAFVISILCVSILLRAKTKFKDEWNRKFVHIAVAHWGLIYYFLLDNFWFALIVPLTFAAMNALSYKKGLIKSIERTEGARYPGTVYYALSIALLSCLGVAADCKLYALAAMLAFGWGDALAGVVGMKFGKKKFPAPLSGKSLIGGAVCFLACFVVVFLVLCLEQVFMSGQIGSQTGMKINILYILGAAFTAGVAGATVEAVSRYGLDNILMPVALFLACMSYGAGVDLSGICLALAISVFVAGLAFGLKALTPGAFFAAIVTGVLLYVLGGAYLFAALIGFFVIASVAGFVKGQVNNNAQLKDNSSGQRSVVSRQLKDKSDNCDLRIVNCELNKDKTDNCPLSLVTYPLKNGRRAVQVFCNSFPALILAALYYFTGRPACLIGAYGALGFALSDTLASELGILSKRRPFDIVTFKPIQKGLSGGVSFLGLLASILGAAAIALFPLFDASLNPAFTQSSPILLNILPAAMVFGSGVLGALFDSFLGSRFQAKYLLPDGSGLVEKPAEDGSYKLARGFRFIDNNLVNLLSCCFAGLICFLTGLVL